MAHLGMDQAMNELPIDHPAPADAGSNRQVDKRIEPSGRSPAVLAQGRAVHVRIKPHRHVECPADAAHDIDVGPARFGCGGDVAIGGRTRRQVDRAERADADRRQSIPLMLLQVCHGLPDGLLRLGRRKAGLV